MSETELKQAVLSGEELNFSLEGKEYLLYGWEQCDGFILSLECDGELIWQSTPQTRSASTEEFLRYFKNKTVVGA
jgi:hypothetical protein